MQLSVGAVPPPGAPPKPKLTEPPTPTAPLWSAFTAVTLVPLWVYVAFHMFVICWDPGQVHLTCQDLSADAPVFFTVTDALKPEPQSLVVVYVAAQAAVDPPPPPRLRRRPFPCRGRPGP